MNEDLMQYGKKVNSTNLKTILEHIFLRNDQIGDQGLRGSPVCIWGTHGLGKTQIVSEFAKEKKWNFAYCAPAQFEEMGDLHGMPEVVNPDKNKIGDEYTIYSPPEWVPTKDGPGILLLDDLNRADDRILRGCMQLLQNFELFSWHLPNKWQIVATANPEGGDYSVTPMDDAMLTRMLHVSLIFDAKAWAKWAFQAGVDQRGIAFVLTYPELVTGKRTTARSLTQFFDQIKNIKNLDQNLQLVSALANSALDEITATTFISFIQDGLTQLIGPEEILESKNFKKIETRINKLSKGEGDVKRVDRIATICTRIFLHLTNKTYKPKSKEKENLISFLLLDVIPNDLRMSLYMDLTKDSSDKVIEMIRDKRLANILLKGM